MCIQSSINRLANDDSAKAKIGKKSRLDMAGITATVDYESTLACIKATKMCSHIKSATQLLDTHDDTGEHVLPLWKPCKLPHKYLRRLYTIIAGSIRPP